MTPPQDAPNRKERYNLRSSLKRTDQEVQAPAPRRVSFAASTSIKPFVNDGDQTIWDTTYQEEINHTDSTDSKTPIKKKTGDSERKPLIAVENLPSNTILEAIDMEFTCQFNYLQCPVTQGNLNELDMELTCCNVSSTKVEAQTSLGFTNSIDQVKLEEIKISEDNRSQYDENMSIESIKINTEEHKITKISFHNIGLREEIVTKEESAPCDEEPSLANIIDSNGNATIAEEQCSLIDLTDCSLPIEVQPVKVIYSEPMKLPDINTSMMHLQLSSTIENTQNLLDAASCSTPANTSISRVSAEVKQILGDLHLVPYIPVQIDRAGLRAAIERAEEVIKKGHEFMSTYQPPQSPIKLESRLSRLSLATSAEESLSSSNKDSCEDYVEESDDLFDQEMEVPKTLADSIQEFFNNSEASHLKLEKLEDHAVFFSTFAGSVWFRAALNEEDHSVTEVVSLRVPGKSSAAEAPYYTLFKFLMEHILSKTQLNVMRSSLGLRFDVLSLLEYVYMITDKCYDFVREFLLLKRNCITLNLDENGTFSFQTRCLRTLTWWTIQFKMVSPEQFQLDSLEVTSKWSDISRRNEHFVTLMRNTEPGIGCLKDFVTSAEDYFKRICSSLQSALKQ